ncbi:DUF4845 domain-containing protein [Entomomonas asaccharolytica]|uniref:DUF4845 domain-containing protein n=1 Tax=Entomomonas asaccharolytica TaxID=2785331 RepID=A0A974RW69_9GAMM|nr:DUF4845 domain-containing protein [Entomomonas asaccharolytica]QQP84888.1 DUF4845 domain-containing protein [Entomomonas asaccharolytica]
MAEAKFSAANTIKNIIIVLFIALIAVLALPIFKVTMDIIDNRVVNDLLENVVKEGEQDSLYGVDQIYDYVQKGLDQNNVKLQAREIIKAENLGSQVRLTVDYRKDNMIFGDTYLSNVFNKTYQAKLK